MSHCCCEYGRDWVIRQQTDAHKRARDAVAALSRRLSDARQHTNGAYHEPEQTTYDARKRANGAYRELDVLAVFGRAEVVDSLIRVPLLCGYLPPGHQPLQT